MRVTAEVGGPLRVVNPWAGRVEISRDGVHGARSGEVLTVETKPGDVVLFRGVD